MHEFFPPLFMPVEEENVLERVKRFAADAHAHQKRKYSDQKYIEHPIRVMESLRDYTTDICVLSAALLHDVLEDTEVDKQELGRFLQSVMDQQNAAKTLRLVEELTDVYIKADYPAMNRRARRTLEGERLGAASPEAQTIKYADIIDNVIDIGANDDDFAPVFMRECKQLLRQINKGDKRLHQRAVDIVDTSLRDFFAKANIRAL